MTAQFETDDIQQDQEVIKNLPATLDSIKTITTTVYEGDKLEAVVTLVEEQTRSLVPDATSEQGRKDIKALARKVASSKTHLDGLGKTLVEPLKARAKEVDAKRKGVRDRLDALKKEILEPVESYEAAQMKRVDDLQAKVDNIKKHASDRDDFGMFLSSEQLKAKLEKVNAIVIDDSYAEFSMQAKVAMHDTQAMIQVHIKNAQDREQQEAERKEKEREEREAREKQIAEDAAERERKRLTTEEENKRVREAAAKKKQDEEKQARISNKNHRQTVKNQAANEIAAMLNVASFDPTDMAIAIIEAIEAGQIPNVSISF
jgi:hypothetical protein